MTNKESIYFALLNKLVNQVALEDTKLFDELLFDLKSINSIRTKKWLYLNSLISKSKLNNTEKFKIVNKNIKSEIMRFWLSQVISNGEFKILKEIVSDFLNSILEIDIKVSESISLQNIETKELILKYLLKNIVKNNSDEIRNVVFYIITISNNDDDIANQSKFLLNTSMMHKVLNYDITHFDSLNKKELINGLFCYLINKKVKEISI
jgi:hypothetical protein